MLAGVLPVHPNSQSQTTDGRVLENNGVVPDITVALDRQELLLGIDAQLQAILDYLAEQNKE